MVARRAGGSRRQILVIAQRDADSVPDATGSAANTAALEEIARVLQGTPSRKTLVLASVDGGTLGDLGVRRLLGEAARPGQDRGGDRALRSGRAGPEGAAPDRLVERSAAGRRRARADGRRIDGAGVRPRAGEQQRRGSDDPAGVPARDRLPGAAAGLGLRRDPLLRQRRAAATAVEAGLADVDVDRLGSLGRSALRTVFAIDQGARELERGPTSYVTVAHKVLPSWSLALLGLSLIAPALVASIDGLARARRRREPMARWARWVLVAGLPLLVVLVLAKLMVWAGVIADPPPTPLPPDLRPMHGGDVVLLGVLAGIAALVWAFVWRWARGGRRERLDPGLARLGVGARARAQRRHAVRLAGEPLRGPHAHPRAAPLADRGDRRRAAARTRPRAARDRRAAAVRGGRSLLPRPARDQSARGGLVPVPARGGRGRRDLREPGRLRARGRLRVA